MGIGRGRVEVGLRRDAGVVQMKSRSRHCNQTVAPRTCQPATKPRSSVQSTLLFFVVAYVCCGTTLGQTTSDPAPQPSPTESLSPSDTPSAVWKNIGEWFDFDTNDSATNDSATNNGSDTDSEEAGVVPATAKDPTAGKSTTEVVEKTIPEDERPRPRTFPVPTTLEPSTNESSSNSPTRQELKELSEWVRSITLMNLPPNVEDNRKWGRTKSVYDGFHLSLDGLRIDTKRKWKTVKHGTWSRYFIEFIDPAERLKIDVTRLEVQPNGRLFSTSLMITTPLKLFGRVSQFQRDVQWISVSTKAEAVVAMQIDCDVAIKLNPLVFPPDIEFRPTVTRAQVDLQEFDVSEISQIHGEAAEWLGKGIQKVLQRKLTDANEKLVEKINTSLAKQQNKLKLSAQAWLSSSFNTSSKPNQPPAP